MTGAKLYAGWWFRDANQIRRKNSVDETLGGAGVPR